MRKAIFFIIAFLIFSKIAVATNYTWIGANIGDDYQAAANWSPARPLAGFTAVDVLIFNTTAPMDIHTVAVETVGGITVTGTFAVLLETDLPGNILIVNGLNLASGSSLLVSTFLTIQLNNPTTLGAGTFGIAPNNAGKIIINSSLTLTGGILNFDVPLTGGTTITGSGSITYNSGTFNSLTSGSITWLSGSNYNHNLNGSSIPTSVWQMGSTCNITGITTTEPSGLAGIDFANFTWNCTGQTSDVDINLPATTVNINGTFSITNTNGKYLRLKSSTTGAVKAGSYTQSVGNLMLQSGAGTNTLTVTNIFSHISGTLDGVGNSAAGAAILDLKGTVTKSATWSCSSSTAGAQMTVQFSGSAAQTVSISGGWTAGTAARCNISITNFTGSGVSLTAGSILKVINNNNTAVATCTMGGYITPAAGAAITYSGTGTGGFTLAYTGAFLQTASVVEFPAASGPTNLTINNSLGVTFPASFSRTISGTLTMSKGNLAIEPGNTLSLTNLSLTNQLAYTGGFITTGTLGRNFPTSGLPTSASVDGRFPFGSGVNDRSLYVFFSSTTLSGGTAGMIFVSHTPSPLPPASINIIDNGITLDKRTITNWTTSTGTFNLGGGGVTISLTAVAANIGAVDQYLKLRLTDGVTAFGTGLAPNPNGGDNIIPITGKSGLTMSDLNKPIYIGSDGLAAYNPLIIITFTWTGAVSTDWAVDGNWSAPTTTGFPSAPTEIAIIDNSLNPLRQPTINTGTNINVYQLIVAAPMTLTMKPSSNLTVYNDVPTYNGNFMLDPGSTFGYASPSAQNIRTFLQPYGNLVLSGTGPKNFPTTITITGAYSRTGGNAILNTNNFIYAGSGSQYVTPDKYYNLTITGNRGGGVITLGYPNNGLPWTIDIGNAFDISGLSNFNYPPMLPILSFTTVNFSSSLPQTIPGFLYPYEITNGTGNRTFDPLGSGDPKHVIYCRTMTRGAGVYILTGSKINIYVSGTKNATYGFNEAYNDLEISGNMNNFSYNFFDGYVSILGKFTVSLTNFQQIVNNNFYYIFNGTGDQTINAYTTVGATPAWKYSNIIVDGNNRNVTMAGTGTDAINIAGSLQVPRSSGQYNTPPYYYGTYTTIYPFGANKGFIVDKSTVNFISGTGGVIPVLLPAASPLGTYNFDKLAVTGSTRILESSNMTVGGTLTISGDATSTSVLKVGDATNPRVFNVLGDVTVSGTGATITGQLDLNPGTLGSTTMNLSKSLSINNRGQITSTGETNGTIVFKGILAHNYFNNSPDKNGLVNFAVGDGIIPNTKLSLLSSLDLVRSATAPNSGTITVLPTDSLDCRIFNIVSNLNNGASGNAKFNLQAGAGLITANTGGIEGVATNGSNGSISNDGTIVRNYDDLASYTFNGSTTTPFPAAITKMADLTVGANVNLNQSIKTSNTLTLGNSVNFNLVNADLTLTSTATSTAKVATVPASASISYGTGRFNVERYYPARRSWRYVTIPLTGTGSIFSTWQNNGVYQAGIGTFVTGPTPANGVDVSIQNNVSLKIGSALTPVSNTNSTTLSANAATSADNLSFFLFVRGDRNLANFNIANSNITTLSGRGKLQTGTQTFPASTIAGAYTLIGNPYASPVDFDTLTKNNVDNTFWVWDPYLNSSLGGYISFSDPYNTGTYLPSVIGPGNMSNIIQSSQAFWVKTSSSGGPASVVFNEEHKSKVYNPSAFREIAKASLFRTNLYLQESNDSSILADGNVVQFDNQFSKKVNSFEDVLKFNNINETFGFDRNNNILSVERRPEITENDTLFFKLTRTKQRDYRLEFVPENLSPVLTAFLEDSYTKINTPVSVSATSTFNFTINADTFSAAPDRFRIVFKTAVDGPLPVRYKCIKAYQQNNDIAVEWAVENELNIIKYEVEKSTDGVNFTKVNTTTVKGASSVGDTYIFLDKNALQGSNFYRILNYNQTGAFEYSRVVVVKVGETSKGISIYPNPVIGNTIELAFNNLAEGKYNIRLINTLGQIMMVKQLIHGAGNSMETLTPNNKLTPGIYQLEITAPDQHISTMKVIVQ